MQKYKAEYEEDLIDLGFDSAIYHGEGAESVLEAIKPEKPSDESVWKVYSFPFITYSIGTIRRSYSLYTCAGRSAAESV